MKSKMDLFLELACPDENGFSRWVNATEFVGIYRELQLGNGGSWCRKSSSLAKKYIVEFDKSQTKGNSIDALRLNGLNTQIHFNQIQLCIFLQICRLISFAALHKG